ETYGVVAHRRGCSEGGAPRWGRRCEGRRHRRGSVSRRIRSAALQMVLWCREEAPGAVDRAEVDGGGRITRRGIRGEERSIGGLGVVLGGCSRWKRSRGSGVAVLRSREGERSSLRALCSVEQLDAEW